MAVDLSLSMGRLESITKRDNPINWYC